MPLKSLTAVGLVGAPAGMSVSSGVFMPLCPYAVCWSQLLLVPDMQVGEEPIISPFSQGSSLNREASVI